MGKFIATVVFEIHDRNVGKQIGWRRARGPLDVANQTVARMLGRDLSRNSLVKAQHVFDAPESVDPSVVHIRVIALRYAKSLLLIKLDLGQSFDRAGSYRKLKSAAVRNIASKLNLTLHDEVSIFGLMFSSSTVDLGMATNLESTWLHIETADEDFYFTTLLHEELVARLGIERSLMNWALSDPVRRLSQNLRKPRVHGALRKWPTELLMDSSTLSQQFRAWRTALNFPAARTELLDKGTSWYVSSAWIVGALGLLLAAISLWNGKS